METHKCICNARDRLVKASLSYLILSWKQWFATRLMTTLPCKENKNLSVNSPNTQSKQLSQCTSDSCNEGAEAAKSGTDFRISIEEEASQES